MIAGEAHDDDVSAVAQSIVVAGAVEQVQKLVAEVTVRPLRFVPSARATARMVAGLDAVMWLWIPYWAPARAALETSMLAHATLASSAAPTSSNVKSGTVSASSTKPWPALSSRPAPDREPR